MKMAKGARILKSEIMYLYIVYHVVDKVVKCNFITLYYITLYHNMLYHTGQREQEGHIQRVVKPAAFIT
jgi:hypothetical protein